MDNFDVVAAIAQGVSQPIEKYRVTAKTVRRIKRG
jgi:hypothetical protein